MYRIKAQVTHIGDIEIIQSATGSFNQMPKREVLISQGPDFPASNLVINLYGDKATECKLVEGEWYLMDIFFKTTPPKFPTWTDIDGKEHLTHARMDVKLYNCELLTNTTSFERIKLYDCIN